MAFGDWLDFWYQNHSKPGLRPTTCQSYENWLYDRLLPGVGHIPLSKLTPSDLQQFYSRLRKEGRLILTEYCGEGLSDRMARSCHANCRTALEKAKAEGLIKTNPAVGCKLPPKKAREM